MFTTMLRRLRIIGVEPYAVDCLVAAEHWKAVALQCDDPEKKLQAAMKVTACIAANKAAGEKLTELGGAIVAGVPTTAVVMGAAAMVGLGGGVILLAGLTAGSVAAMTVVAFADELGLPRVAKPAAKVTQLAPPQTVQQPAPAPAPTP